MKQNNIYQTISLAAAILFLFIMVTNSWPYGVYQLVRWVVFASSIYNVYQQATAKKYFWVTAFIFLAILFNPFAPIYFLKNTWRIIDVITALFLIIACYILNKK